MQCLYDYIGIRWCKAVEPESNLWINDLPGISLKVLDKIADEEQKTFLEVWNTIQRRAIQRINTAVTNEFGKRYKIKSVTEFTELPDGVNDTTNQTAADAEHRGFTLKIGGEHWVSALQVIHVQSLKLYLKADTDLEVKFYKVVGTTLTEIHSIDVTGKVGWNAISVNKDFLGVTKLFIGYDATAVSSIETKLDTTLDGSCCDACCESECGMNIQAAKYDGTDLTTGNNLFGLSGVVSVKCKYEMIVCNNKSLFATALWYLEGAEAMAERIFSDRINRYTTVDIGRARELRDEWEFRFKEELTAAMNGIELGLGDCCLECNGQVRVVDNVP